MERLPHDTAESWMGGGVGTSRQAAALTRLSEIIPAGETMAFPKLDHFAPEKKPGEIADAALRFFAAHAHPGAADLSQTSHMP